MMSERFTASNGWYVENANLLTPGGTQRAFISSPQSSPLIEYGRHLERTERDAELGRWRSKAHPDYVVYLFGKVARVVDETTSLAMSLTKSDARGSTPGFLAGEVAREYFDAQEPPTSPKPWLNAKPGEVWALWYDDEPEDERAMLCQKYPGGGLQFAGEGKHGYHGLDYPHVITGSTRGSLHLRIRPAAGGAPFPVHPTWEMEYLEDPVPDGSGSDRG